jgi:hypothetical protein
LYPGDEPGPGGTANLAVLGGNLPPSVERPSGEVHPKPFQLPAGGLAARSTRTTTNVIRVIDQLTPPERRARQAFCLLLLNLNEVVYVD